MAGIPTGQIEFHDGNASLGTVPLDGTGVSILRNNTLTTGAHSLTASYAGDGKFEASNSATVTINITNPDFSLFASPSSANVIAGQSTQFMLTVTPAGGFASDVTFSCSPVNGITCTFSPATVNTANGAASTKLTVTTNANVLQFGNMLPELNGPGSLFAALALFGLLLWGGRRVQSARPAVLPATALMGVLGLSLMAGACGGYGKMPSNRGTATVNVTAQAGTTSHATTVRVTVQ